jgi:hypothetical protein
VHPELVIHNTLDVEIDTQVFAKKAKQCSTSSLGMSKEQRLSSFARDNGVCGVRNYFTYDNITTDVRVSTDEAVLDVPDKRILRTTQREEQLLTDENDASCAWIVRVTRKDMGEECCASRNRNASWQEKR